MTGFLLSTDVTDKEFFQAFLDNWERRNGTFDVDIERIIRIGLNWTPLNRSEFLTLMKHEVDCYLIEKSGKYLALKYYDSEVHPVYERMIFTPLLRNDNSLNVFDFDGNCIPRDLTKTRWTAPASYIIIPTDYIFEGPYYFADGNKRYEKPEDVIKEFKKKVGIYLPENFNWNSHVGYIEYSFLPIQDE